MPAKAGIQYAVTPKLNGSDAEYWIIRWSLSSGGACADPVADDDVGARCAALRVRIAFVASSKRKGRDKKCLKEP
jgi:hypothetical protein